LDCAVGRVCGGVTRKTGRQSAQVEKVSRTIQEKKKARTKHTLT